MKVPDNVSRSQLTEAIDEWVVGTNAERNRRLLKRRYIDGVRLEPLAEEFDLSWRQVQSIIAANETAIFEHPKLAETLNELSREEQTHINRLHDEVVRIIEEYRKEKGEPPADMLAVYEYLHKRHIEKALEIKRYQSIYKEM